MQDVGEEKIMVLWDSNRGSAGLGGFRSMKIWLLVAWDGWCLGWELRYGVDRLAGAGWLDFWAPSSSSSEGGDRQRGRDTTRDDMFVGIFLRAWRGDLLSSVFVCTRLLLFLGDGVFLRGRGQMAEVYYMYVWYDL